MTEPLQGTSGTSLGPTTSHDSPVPPGSSCCHVAWYQVTRRFEAPSDSPLTQLEMLMLVSPLGSLIWFEFNASAVTSHLPYESLLAVPSFEPGLMM